GEVPDEYRFGARSGKRAETGGQRAIVGLKSASKSRLGKFDGYSGDRMSHNSCYAVLGPASYPRCHVRFRCCSLDGGGVCGVGPEMVTMHESGVRRDCAHRFPDSRTLVSQGRSRGDGFDEVILTPLRPCPIFGCLQNCQVLCQKLGVGLVGSWKGWSEGAGSGHEPRAVVKLRVGRRWKVREAAIDRRMDGVVLDRCRQFEYSPASIT